MHQVFWQCVVDSISSYSGMFIRGSRFGQAHNILFKVIRYDDGPLAVLRDTSELQEYIAQNTSRDIQQRRQVRISLRALEGQRVVWPYEHITVGRVGLPGYRVCLSRLARGHSFVLVLWTQTL